MRVGEGSRKREYHPCRHQGPCDGCRRTSHDTRKVAWHPRNRVQGRRSVRSYDRRGRVIAFQGCDRPASTIGTDRRSDRTCPAAYPHEECGCSLRCSFLHRYWRRLCRSDCVRVSPSLRCSVPMGVNRPQRRDGLSAPSSRSICGMARDSGPTFCCSAPTSLSRLRDHGAPKFGDGKCRLHSSIGSALRQDRSCAQAPLSTACSISAAQPNAHAVLSANGSTAWKAIQSLNFDTVAHPVLSSEVVFGSSSRSFGSSQRCG